jgi:hypothetical protein
MAKSPHVDGAQKGGWEELAVPYPITMLCMHALDSWISCNQSFHQNLVKGSDVVLPKINAVLNFFNSIF